MCARLPSPTIGDTLARSPERTQEPAGLRHHLATERHIGGLGSAVAAMEEPAVAATTTVREDLGRGGSVVIASGTAAPLKSPNYRSSNYRPVARLLRQKFHL